MMSAGNSGFCTPSYQAKPSCDDLIGAISHTQPEISVDVIIFNWLAFGRRTWHIRRNSWFRGSQDALFPLLARLADRVIPDECRLRGLTDLHRAELWGYDTC